MTGFAGGRPEAAQGLDTAFGAVERLAVRAAAFAVALYRQYEDWQAVRQLQRMTDWQLEDMGLRREQIAAAVRGKVAFRR
jgi:uncharacterized protein YjiS (DUF1127 family)